MSRTAGQAYAVSTRTSQGSFLLGAGLILVLLSVLAARSQWIVLSAEKKVAIDLAAARHEQGMAWIVKLDADLLDELDQAKSPPRVLEDGEPLRRDDTHQHIRDSGGGLYSIWGPQLYFSTHDGSDPLTNGHRFELALPDGAATPPVTVIPAMAMAGLVLVLIGLVLQPGVLRILLTVMLLGLVGGPLAADVFNTSWSHSLDQLQVKTSDTHSALRGKLARASAHGNTTRLLGPDSTPRFDLLGEPPQPTQPVVVRFAPEACTRSQEGVYRLATPSCGLTGMPDRLVMAADLAEFVLPVRLIEGESLRIDWIQSESAPTKLNGYVLPVRPSPKWQTLRITEPLGLYLGSDRVPFEGLRISKPAASHGPTVLEIGELIASEHTAIYSRSPQGFAPFETQLDRRPARWQSAPGEFTIPWPAGAGRTLKGALTAKLPPGESALTYEVFWAEESGDRHRLLRDELMPSSSAAWTNLRAEIPIEAQPTELIFRCPDLRPPTVLAWGAWRLVDTSRPPHHVFFTLADTLRADALSCYGGEHSKTPQLDALAAQGVLFERAYGQCFWTRPSMASLMTGRYVSSVGVQEAVDRLPSSYTTLAEVFRDAGFYTAAFITNSNAGPDSGLDQGWDEILLRNVSPAVPDAATFIRRFVRPAADDLLDEDLLFYVHLMDAHGPYGPVDRPANWETPPGIPVPWRQDLDRDWLQHPTDAARISLYSRDVESMDAAWGQLFQDLRGIWEEGRSPPAIVALAADHGEFLGEYDQWSHIYYRLTPEVVHVPLILRAPGALPAGVRLDTPVENIDLAPTLIELAGLPPGRLGAVEGRSLVDLARGDASADFGLAVSTASEETGLLSLYSSTGALIGSKGKLDGMLLEDETGPVTAPQRLSQPEDVLGKDLVGRWKRLSLSSRFSKDWKSFSRSRQSIRKTLWADVDQSSSELDPATLAQLREMGYLR